MPEFAHKNYWKSPEERDRSPVFLASIQAENPDPAPDLQPAAGSRGPAFERRDFLKLAGFAIGAGALAGCARAPERKARPYLVKPEEVTPGKACWYATVCGGCAAGCGALAKNREGRPIKLEGNPDHPLSRGGLCPTGQASVLGLYDSRRLAAPLLGGRRSSWARVDEAVRAALAEVRHARGGVRLLSETTTSPTEQAGIAAFLAGFTDSRHVIHDPISASALLKAHAECFGRRVLPRLRFEHARVIVSLDADFLGPWISPVEHAAGYALARRLDGPESPFCWHAQFEARLSLTGSRADRRTAVAPGSAGIIAAHLAAAVAEAKRAPWPLGALPESPAPAPAAVAEAARRLLAVPGGKALVVCGANDLPAQRLVAFTNHLLGAYGTTNEETTIDLERVSRQKAGDDEAISGLTADLEAGRVGALLVRGVNPVYDLPDGERFARAMAKCRLVVSFACWEDETSAGAHAVCPEHHFLEAWGDAEPANGFLSIRQPVTRPIGATRAFIESLAAFAGQPRPAHAQIVETWKNRLFPRQSREASFQRFWDQTLHDGVITVAPDKAAPLPPFNAEALTAPAAPPTADPGGGALLLDAYVAVGMLDGRNAHNAWLHELPDPITKVTWENVAGLAADTARRLGVSDGDLVRLTPARFPADGEGGSAGVVLPALIQPGQHEAAVAVARGYGRRGTDRFAAVGPQWWEGQPTVEPGGVVGVSVQPLMSATGAPTTVRVEKAGGRRPPACTQMHHSLFVPESLAVKGAERRPHVEEMTLAEWRTGPRPLGERREQPSLWHDDFPPGGHRWGMVVDLTACNGCSACVIACQAENNVPVVGRDEVFRAREMHWLRLDRYYAGDGAQVDVVQQPMMCQHCDHAPCETVCPVLATARSSEGLNQQVYNRCLGTRYCANNCPYKVRRFNWFDYPREDRLQNLALNPDVTVRTRGVMEKCSLCVQRIQEAKAEAKRRGEPLKDGEIEPACAQSCPAKAIVFGDMADPESRLSKLMKDPRHYHVLAELGVRPVVGYLAMVRDRG